MNTTENKQWKTKDGFVNMSEMSEEHLQNALRHAEHRFIQYNNMMMHMSEKAEIFETKMLELKKEGEKRNFALKSLCETNQGKYDILRNTYRLAEKCTE
jgi:hypothetical protein